MMYQNMRHLIHPESVEEKDASSIHYLMLPQVRYPKASLIAAPLACCSLSPAHTAFATRHTHASAFPNSPELSLGISN